MSVKLDFKLFIHQFERILFYYNHSKHFITLIPSESLVATIPTK